MKVSTISVTQITTALALVAMLASETEASKKFVKMLPNGGNVPDTPAIGHSDGTGKSAATNAFGDAFAAAGYKWTKEFCQADTDGDGQTNGQELGDPQVRFIDVFNLIYVWGGNHDDCKLQGIGWCLKWLSGDELSQHY
ncbi:Calcium-activated potassium channel subunit alpha-1 [Phytophthora cinnamomi]|uniref:Calcium-activated potassium channel subunit alpha-1 n=1 Tax=Phytophthora cinnamomi TaxID=4785 RepID=UPI003559D089|nr:Calcium-activated potassium channel subunit alpha-1 [Phytophthora cinnamomi]